MKFVLTSTRMKQEDHDNVQEENPFGEYAGNIWGWKWSWISLIIILIFLGIATCRYLVIKPDRLVYPEQVEEFG